MTLEFIFGSDAYQINYYLKQTAPLAVVFDFSEEAGADLKKLAAVLNGVSLFDRQPTKVVLKNVFKQTDKNTKEKLIKLLMQDSPVKVFLVELREPDKRDKLFKFLKLRAKLSHFDLLKDYQLKQWLKTKTSEFGGEIKAEALEKLAFEIGSDLYRAEQEIKKLVNFSSKITLAAVNDLVQNKLEDDIFLLTDALASKRKDRALKLLADQIDSGRNELYLLTMLAFVFRNLLLVKDLSSQGLGQTEIASRASIHPFVVGKALQQSQSFDLDKLKKTYLKLVDLDEAVKIGKIDARLGLELLIISA